MASMSADAVVAATAIAASQANASARLRNALITGSDTAGIRRELADLEIRATQLAADQARQADTEEAAMAEQIEAGAKILAADARTRVASLLAALEIPPAPSCMESVR